MKKSLRAGQRNFHRGIFEGNDHSGSQAGPKIQRMRYSKEILRDLESKLNELPAQNLRLLEAYVSRNYATARGREFALHGFARRLKILLRCLTRIFEILPPSLTDLVQRELLDDVEIHLQAFIINVFGSLDNLAWTWVSERDLCIRDSWVGLGPDNSDVRQSLSPEFRGVLASFDPWFGQLKDYRHALAHRIPLYVPPYVVRACDQAMYLNLAQQIQAALRRRDFEETSRLEREHEMLAVFSPEMMHSFEEGATPIAFHAQAMSDFLTVQEIAWKMLAELAMLGTNESG
jgi:hypothetical protein